MSDLADSANDLIEFTLQNAVRASKDSASHSTKICEECQESMAMILPNGVQARYCADCWTEIRGAE